MLVHGYLTVEGQKISKSGASVEVEPLVERLGADALRYYLLREVSTVRDGDFRIDRFIEAYNAALANQLGNLVSRVLRLVERYRDGLVPAPHDSEIGDAERELVNIATRTPERVVGAVEQLDFPAALDAIFDVVAAANAYADRREPWQLARTGSADRLDTVLWHLVESVRFVGELLIPFLPSTAARIADRVDGVLSTRTPRWGLVGPGTRAQKGAALFPRVGRPAS